MAQAGDKELWRAMVQKAKGMMGKGDHMGKPNMMGKKSGGKGLKPKPGKKSAGKGIKGKQKNQSRLAKVFKQVVK